LASAHNSANVLYFPLCMQYTWFFSFFLVSNFSKKQRQVQFSKIKANSYAFKTQHFLPLIQVNQTLQKIENLIQLLDKVSSYKLWSILASYKHDFQILIHLMSKDKGLNVCSSLHTDGNVRIKTGNWLGNLLLKKQKEFLLLITKSLNEKVCIVDFHLQFF
jgi:hypothetical protein